MKTLKAVTHDPRPKRAEKRRRAEAGLQPGPLMPMPELIGRHALATLPEQMALTTEWLKYAASDDTLVLADDILRSWSQLRKFLSPPT